MGRLMVSPAYAQKVFKHYGNDSIKKVKEDPYQLSRDIHGFGFKSADKIAQLKMPQVTLTLELNMLF